MTLMSIKDVPLVLAPESPYSFYHDEYNTYASASHQSLQMNTDSSQISA